jgi:hypothetical protein
VTDDRQSGVTFGDLKDDLETEEYPLSNEDLLDQYGDREVTHANGSVTVRELVEPMEEVTYESADDVQQELLNMVGEGAVGRKEYSDRGVQTQGEDYEEESF